jgi:regulator of replication initiation timing
MDIDDSDFGCLGIPTPLEIWKQQCVLLATEIEEHQADLRRCRANIAKLVDINSALVAERDELAAESTKLRWKLSDIYLKQSQEDTAKRGYHYPAYSKGD